MKNLLIATTALVATAGVAAADINLTGSARFGIIYTDTAGVTATNVHNRMTVNVNGSVETDSGVEFFGYVRVRGGNTGDGLTATSATAIGAPRVGAKIGGLTVAVGNINGAIDGSAGVYSGSVGLTGLGYSNVIVGGYDGYSSTGGGTNGVEVIYAANGLNVHLSHSDDQRATGIVVDAVSSTRTALALGYTFGDWKVNLGVQSGSRVAANEDFTVISADGKIGSVNVGAAISDSNGTNAWRLNAGFEVGAGTNVTVFVADTDGAAETAYGVGFTHSLGGATLAGGLVNDNAGDTKADFGVRFNF